MATEEEIDFSKLSIEDRVQHKNWKGRVAGFEALIKLFNNTEDERSLDFAKYASCLKKAPVETNVMALEKGLAAIQALLNNAPPTTSGKIAGDIISGCLSKAILQTRPKVKELNADIILMYVELERHELVQEELLKGAENKSPKVAVGCILLLRESLRQFGIKVIKIGPIIKLLPTLLEHKDKTIREEARLLSVEIYRWIKDAMKPQIANLKPVILNELEEEFAKLKDERACPTRFLCSEQVRTQEVNIVNEGDNAECSNAEDVGSANGEIDPFEFFDPVEIISKLPSDFYEKCEAKKWQERKEALEGLLQLMTPNPKLATGDYSELVKILKKIIGKDSNVMVVGVAGKCLAELATRLRKSFTPYAHSCVAVIIEKFKEKKQNVVISLREAIDAVMLSISFEIIIEDIVLACDNKNPQIKIEVVQFISRFVSNSPLDFLANKKNLKLLVNALTKTLNDNDGGVREFSAESLGILMKAVGEKSMTPLLSEVDSIRIAKIKEYFEKAEIKHRLPVTRSMSAPNKMEKKTEQEPKKTSSTNSTVVRPKTTAGAMPRKHASSTSSNKNLSETGDNVPRPATAVPSSKSKTVSAGMSKVSSKSRIIKATPPTKSEVTAATQPLMSKNALKKQRLTDEKLLKWNFSTPRDEYFLELKESMQQAGWNSTLVLNCFHTDFKYHLRAIDSIGAFISGGAEQEQTAISNSDLILKWAALRFFDTNPSVILKLLELLLKLFTAFKNQEQLFGEQEAQSFIPYLILKTGDPKDVLRQKVHDITTRLKDIYSPVKLFAFFMNGLSSKNARQRATCIEELGYMIRAYGMGIFHNSLGQTCKEISRQIGDKDSGVRNSALNCILEIYQFEEDRVFKLIGSLNDKDMEMLEKRIKRAGKQQLNNHLKPLEPTILVKDLPSPPVSAVIKPVQPLPMPAALGRSRSPTPEQEDSPVSNVQQTVRRPMQFKPKTPSTASKLQNANGNDNEIEIQFNRNFSRKIVSTRTRTPSPEPISNRHTTSQSTVFLPEELEQRLVATGRVAPKLTSNQYAITQIRRPQAIPHYSSEAADDLLAMPDVELPARVRLSTGNSPRKSFGASASEKTDRLINTYISQLSQIEIEQSLEAAQQIGRVLVLQDRAKDYFTNKVDQLIMLCSIQYKLVITKHLSDPQVSEHSVRQLLGSITGLLMAVFQNEVLSKNASLESLKELISLIINLIVDSRVSEFVNDGCTMRSINQLANIILSNSDISSMLSALIRILHECISGSVGSSNLAKFTDLITKCIWKIIHLFKNSMGMIKLDQILLDIHHFLSEYPSSYWKDPTKNSPLRTIRTILFFFVKVKKNRIFNYLERIPDYEHSELYRILKKTYEVQKEREGDEDLEEEDQRQVDLLIVRLKTDTDSKTVLELIEFCGRRPKFNLEEHLYENYTQSFAERLIQEIASVKKTGQLLHTNGSGVSSKSIKSVTLTNNQDPSNRFGFNRSTPRIKLGRLVTNEELRNPDFNSWFNNTCTALNQKPMDSLHSKTSEDCPTNNSIDENILMARNRLVQHSARKDQLISKFNK